MKVCGYLMRYDELALKGKNRFFFEKKLISNIKEKLKEVSITIDHLWGRILVRCEENMEVRRQLLKIFGISSLSPIVEAPSDLSSIQEEALALVPNRSSTFRVTTRRVDKKFPLTSRAVNIEVAHFVLPKRPLLKIDLDDPELELGIEIREEKTFLFLEKESGLGGLPVGTSGKVLTLLSGGIDSPVAAWMMMKRGCPVEYIHFYSYPYTGEQSKEKVLDLVRTLSCYQNKSFLHIVSFGEIQEALQRHCNERYRTLLYRRFMQRIATEVAHRRESIGQVASQTVENISAVSTATDILILRPLIGFNKNETISLSKKIGTYEISIRPFEDCCTLFQPQAPATKARLLDLLQEEEKVPYKEFVQGALSHIETLSV
ncbi:MAG: tRNA 4-thiouridine(8) synthase ThiI [Deltaproteobacteria bacterium]|nr:tRNA 4-thiouridine(8) synthase ThiI [Deltaproteobacteria bacterium]